VIDFSEDKVNDDDKLALSSDSISHNDMNEAKDTNDEILSQENKLN
jgi:hypothetical protein